MPPARLTVWEASILANGLLEKWERRIILPGDDEKVNAKPVAKKRGSYPNGLALSADEKLALVCLSVNNSVGVVDLDSGKLVEEIPVGVAPYHVVFSPDGDRAYVSNWGGRRAAEGDRAGLSAGTLAVVDERGIGASGTIGVIDVKSRRQISEIEVGLHPADLIVSQDGKTIFVANANSDTVSIIDTVTLKVRETVLVRPDASLFFGSAVNCAGAVGG